MIVNLISKAIAPSEMASQHQIFNFEAIKTEFNADYAQPALQ